MGSSSASCNVPAAESFLPLGRGGAEAGAARLLWESATCKLRAFDPRSARGKDAPTRSVSYSINFSASTCTLKKQVGKGLQQMPPSHARAWGCSWLGWEHGGELGAAVLLQSSGAAGDEGLESTTG